MPGRPWQRQKRTRLAPGRAICGGEAHGCGAGALPACTASLCLRVDVTQHPYALPTKGTAGVHAGWGLARLVDATGANGVRLEPPSPSTRGKGRRAVAARPARACAKGEGAVGWLAPLGRAFVNFVLVGCNAPSGMTVDPLLSRSIHEHLIGVGRQSGNIGTRTRSSAATAR